ncbi:MAG: D-alanine--D-alanine ligase [Rhodospirillaceae bacterium]|jgi:D-alanine-D-alanine ligase|nr:D-alanine--D-alanine ligase [Rhodospirillaceae bacterium]MBT5239899.1 D-alanine--D-alanine ligase [Rhodospirillaceae bacterium]MBT5565225.1 D-alanine--D-alanine ligase [Rhodospirillaceae bacterium]MBT6091083.1 D-alanine--D-alanine ligase [Rhodospirillaceae bacterium]MBT6961200.1 D-alanine--D-alanine ligase [Rhodospirillaceae bacterium]
MTAANASKRVAVLYGGFSSERDVSLVSGRDAATALETAGYDVTTIDVPRDMPALTSAIVEAKPDVVFNALHGRYGEDGCIQGLLDMMALPYTNSGRSASALAMDKSVAKRLFAAAGLPVAEEIIVSRKEAERSDPLPRPYVIKPINEGSAVGVHIVLEGDNKAPLDDMGLDADSPIMVERYIPGREVTVTVMGDRALAVTEITTDRQFYDYDAKYAAGGSIHSLPAVLSQPVYDRALEVSLTAHRALGCRGVTRSDLRLDGDDLYLLEINTQPGLTPTSLVPEQAAHVGMSFADLVSWMVENAQCDA